MSKTQQQQPPKQDPEQGNQTNPRLKEPAGPGLYLSGMDEPGKPSKKNPGHTNPAHNTPGHDRRDMQADGPATQKKR